MNKTQRVINLISDNGGDHFAVPVANIDFVRFTDTAIYLHLKSGKVLTQNFVPDRRDLVWKQIEQALSGVPL